MRPARSWSTDACRPPARSSATRTLRGRSARIAERGRDGYYRGPTAEAIVAMLKAHGSPMDAQDLAEFDVEWVQPISTTYQGLEGQRDPT